ISEGGQRPLMEASMGWMIMSDLPPREVESICFRYNQKHGRNVFDYREVHRKLSEIAKDGYCIYEEPLHSYTAISVAMKLPQLYNYQNLVIGIGGDITRVEPKIPEVLSEMRKLLADING